mmetsp:Transcript_24571/g.33768  ORF Transcript_24571/g.33768 Transcript_24571/m.33768 type:complete len:159 (-) Transcript_24571:1273-1749(-)
METDIEDIMDLPMRPQENCSCTGSHNCSCLAANKKRHLSVGGDEPVQTLICSQPSRNPPKEVVTKITPRKKDFFGNTLFRRDEIAKHNTLDSCWLIVDGDVLDVTSYLSQHPAGSRPILKKGGTDATVDFNFHSRETQNLWKSCKIGKVDEPSDCVIC